MSGPHDEFVAWAKGRTDALGGKFSDWLVARHNPDGTLMRDASMRQVFETQAEYLARSTQPINTTAAAAAPIQVRLFE